MSTTEYQQTIAAMRQAIEAQAPMIALGMAQTGLTLQKRDIIEDGIRIDGSFADYSTKPVYKSSFKSKALNSGGKQWAESGGKGTWGQFKEAQGRGSAHVNLTYTGRTLAALQIQSQTQNGHRYSVLTGCSDTEATRILIANIKRYGNFLAFDEDRINVIGSDAVYEVNKIIKEYL